MITLAYPKFWHKRNWIAFVMMPFSYIYILLGFIRGKITKNIELPQQVICVGNITLGGARKTQIVVWLAKILKQKEVSFVIVTQAYKSDLVGGNIG